MCLCVCWLLSLCALCVHYGVMMLHGMSFDVCVLGWCVCALFFVRVCFVCEFVRDAVWFVCCGILCVSDVLE